MSAEVAMVIPAASRFVSTVRLTTASLAAELDFSIEEIDALQMGANELVALLIELAEDHQAGQIQLRYILHDDAIEVHGTVDIPALDAPLLDPLTEQILSAVVDSYHFEGNAGQVTKQRAQR